MHIILFRSNFQKLNLISALNFNAYVLQFFVDFF